VRSGIRGAIWPCAVATLLAVGAGSLSRAAPANAAVYCGKDDFKRADEQEKLCLGQLAQLAS
jgi:hypothetical protein